MYNLDGVFHLAIPAVWMRHKIRADDSNVVLILKSRVRTIFGTDKSSGRKERIKQEVCVSCENYWPTWPEDVKTLREKKVKNYKSLKESIIQISELKGMYGYGYIQYKPKELDRMLRMLFHQYVLLQTFLFEKLSP